jgi:hypothetical protein
MFLPFIDSLSFIRIGYDFQYSDCLGSSEFAISIFIWQNSWVLTGKDDNAPIISRYLNISY